MSTAICNINGGTLQAGLIGRGSGTANFNWNDGTIQNYDTSTDLIIYTNLKLAATGTHVFNIDPGRTGTVYAILSDATTNGSLTKTGSGVLTLAGANTYSGDTIVEGGLLSIRIPYLNNLAGVHISSGAMLDLSFLSNDTVGSLYLNGLQAASGTWGSSLSSATHIDNVHFSGTGMLNVVPEPSALILLGMGAFGLFIRAWRRDRGWQR